MSGGNAGAEIKLLSDEVAVKTFVSSSVRDWAFYTDRRNLFLKEIRKIDK